MRVNGECRIQNYHARGCPFELTLGGKTWVVDGILNYGDSSDWSGEFIGTLTHKKEVVSISYTSGSRDFCEQDYDDDDYFDEDEQEDIKEALEYDVFANYKWNQHE